MCEFLFTSYRQQRFYPWLSKRVWSLPHSTRLRASRAWPPLKLCSSLLRLAESHTTNVLGYCHQCVTVSAEDQGLAIHRYDLLLPMGLPSLFWFLTWFSHLLRKRLFLLLLPSFFFLHRQQNIQWCLEGEWTLIKTEHEPVPRSRGAQRGRSRRSWIPFPELFKHIGVPRREAGAEALGSSFPHLTPLIYMPPVLVCLSIAFIHSLLWTPSQEIQWFGFFYLADFSHVFPDYLQHLGGRRSHKIHHPFSQICSKVSSEAMSGFKSVHSARFSQG